MTLMNNLAGAARHVGFNATDETTIQDVVTQLQVDWRHLQTSWGVIYQETLMNRGERLIFNILKPRRAAAMIDLVEELESAAWSSPAAGDKVLPYGLPYYVVKNATQGFNGGLPSGHTTVAGVNITDTPTYQNWTDTYAAISKADLVKKARKAHRKCRFKSPITIQDYRSDMGERYRVYVNEETLSEIEDIGEAQNESLGRDIASMDGTMVFRNHPILWVPQLDSDTQNPWYMVDHSTFTPVCLTGDYLRESMAERHPDQHNTVEILLDQTYDYVCSGRRRNAAI